MTHVKHRKIIKFHEKVSFKKKTKNSAPDFYIYFEIQEIPLRVFFIIIFYNFKQSKITSLKFS